ncbi:MAG: YihY/virulence factor BrkB family protein [Chloroflexi bacterium]|nr:YihY/virulence factor BrkB family protein [Chloroflexota bacterium]
MGWRQALLLIKATWALYQRQRGPRMAAALAYYAVFSLAPLLVIAVSVAGLFVSRREALGQLYAQVYQAAGQEVANLVLRMLEPSFRESTSVLAAAIGLATLLWGALGIFVQLRDALNELWEVPPPPGLSIREFLRTYAVSLPLVALAGLVLLALVIAATVLSALEDWLGGLRGLAQVVNLVVVTAITALLFGVVYKVVPARQLPWRAVIVGAVVTAVLFLLGRSVLAFYLTRFAPTSAFGAAGALVVLLLWAQYSAQIVLLGAAFTRVWAQRHALPLASAPAEGGDRTEPA